jgi:hypothetical protein
MVVTFAMTRPIRNEEFYAAEIGGLVMEESLAAARDALYWLTDEEKVVAIARLLDELAERGFAHVAVIELRRMIIS